MKYPKQAVIGKLNAMELDFRKRASEAETQANVEADVQDRIDDLKDKYERLGTLIEQGRWSKSGSAAYEIYNAANSIARGVGGPNYSSRDQHLANAKHIQLLSELLAQTPEDTVSTSELKDLGILNIIKYK